MDPIVKNEEINEVKPEPEQQEFTLRPRQRKRRKSITVPVPAFLTHLGEDVRWYFDIRLWSPVIVLVLILALIPGRKEEPALPVETVPPVTEGFTLPVEETEPVAKPVIPEAEALAILADSVGSGRSDNVKTVIMWVAINRAEDQANGYGKSLLEEIARPNQWQGYDEATVYSETTYALAEEVLRIQAEGKLRPLDSDMLWFVLNDNGSITLRNRFNVDNSRNFREKTVK